MLPMLSHVSWSEGECSPKAMGFKNVSELYHPIGMSGIFIYIYIIIIYVTTTCNEKSTVHVGKYVTAHGSYGYASGPKGFDIFEP